MKRWEGIFAALLMAAPLMMLGQAQEPAPLTLHGLELPGDSSQSFVQYMGGQTATVAAGKPTTITLTFRVKEGFHINSHKPTSDLMIPTRLGVAVMDGLNVTAVDFPPGHEYAFSYDPKTKLSVYSGDFALTVHLTAKRGAQKFSGLLKYQACDHAACYPPKSLPFVVTVTAM
jgi:hypothetical protein